MSGFTAVSYQSKNVGSFIKSSRRKESWVFKLLGVSRRIDVFTDRLSGNLKILLDGSLKFDERKPKVVSIPIKINSRILYVYQKRDSSLDLRVGRISFSKLMEENIMRMSYRSSRAHYPQTNFYEESWNISKDDGFLRKKKTHYIAPNDNDSEFETENLLENLNI